MDRLQRLQQDIKKLDSDAARVMAWIKKDMDQREGESQEEYSARLRPYLTHVDHLILASLRKHDQYIQALREQANAD